MSVSSIRARRSHLAGRALLRTVLSRYAPASPDRWRLLSNLFGRPFVATEDVGWDLRFNLSHTNELVALVVANACDVGVDVDRGAGYASYIIPLAGLRFRQTSSLASSETVEPGAAPGKSA